MFMSKKAYAALIIILISLAGLRLLTFNKPKPGPPTGFSHALNADGEQDIEVPLAPPFYPDFETVWELTDRVLLETHLYTIDETAYVYDEELDIDSFLEMDFSAPLKGEPKILIFHTHSREGFSDSRPGEAGDTIVGVGSLLARILSEEYGISVVHDFGQYDVVDGEECREGSYERMEPAILALLDKYPGIEITLDLHRDGVPDDIRLVSVIDDKPTARIMFFNGITRLNKKGGPEGIPLLPNPHVRQNMGLSLQAQLTVNSLYPGFARRLFIKPYRYSLHFKPKSMLIEVGANTNTVEEAMNAMKPLAEVLVKVLGE